MVKRNNEGTVPVRQWDSFKRVSDLGDGEETVSDQELVTDSPEGTLRSDDGTPVGGDPYQFLLRLRVLGQTLSITSDAELARRLGVSLTALKKWRRGNSAPFRSTLVKIAERTGTRLEWLETGQGKMLAEAGAAPMPAAPAVARPAGATPRLQQLVTLDDLVAAYEHAQRAFAARGVAVPEPRKLLALTLHLYDAAMETLTEAAEHDSASAQIPPPDQS